MPHQLQRRVGRAPEEADRLRRRRQLVRACRDETPRATNAGCAARSGAHQRSNAAADIVTDGKMSSATSIFSSARQLVD